MRRFAAVLAVATMGMGLLAPVVRCRCMLMHAVVTHCCCPPAGHVADRLECCTAADRDSSREPSELTGGGPALAFAALIVSPIARVDRPAEPGQAALRWRTAEFPGLAPPVPLRI